MLRALFHNLGLFNYFQLFIQKVANIHDLTPIVVLLSDPCPRRAGISISSAGAGRGARGR